MTIKGNAIHFTPKILQHNWHKQVGQFMVSEVLTVRRGKNSKYNQFYSVPHNSLR